MNDKITPIAPEPAFEGLPEEKKIEILRNAAGVTPRDNEENARRVEEFLANGAAVKELITKRDQTAFLAHQTVCEAAQEGLLACFDVMSSSKDVKVRRQALAEAERLAKLFHDYGVGAAAAFTVAVPEGLGA